MRKLRYMDIKAAPDHMNFIVSAGSKMLTHLSEHICVLDHRHTLISRHKNEHTHTPTPQFACLSIYSMPDSEFILIWSSVEPSEPNSPSVNCGLNEQPERKTRAVIVTNHKNSLETPCTCTGSTLGYRGIGKINER